MFVRMMKYGFNICFLLGLLLLLTGSKLKKDDIVCGNTNTFSSPPQALGNSKILKLAKKYQYGIGTNLNYTKAIKLYKKVINQDSDKYSKGLASYYLACLYNDYAYRGQTESKKNIVKLLDLAISNGCYDACSLLAGINYYQTKDYKDCLRLVKLGVKNNNPPCLVHLGYIYRYNSDEYGIRTDLSKTYDYFSRAAEAGYPWALISLSRFYYDEYFLAANLTEKNIPKALDLVHRAIKNNPEKYGALLDLYRYIDESKIKAPEYLENIIRKDKHNNLAKIALADCYLKGLGVRQDALKGSAILELLAEQGDLGAKLKLLGVYGSNYVIKNSPFSGYCMSRDYSKTLKPQPAKLYFLLKDLADNDNLCNGILVDLYLSRANIVKDIYMRENPHSSEDEFSSYCDKRAIVYLDRTFANKQYSLYFRCLGGLYQLDSDYPFFSDNYKRCLKIKKRRKLYLATAIKNVNEVIKNDLYNLFAIRFIAQVYFYGLLGEPDYKMFNHYLKLGIENKDRFALIAYEGFKASKYSKGVISKDAILAKNSLDSLLRQLDDQTIVYYHTAIDILKKIVKEATAEELQYFYLQVKSREVKSDIFKNLLLYCLKNGVGLEKNLELYEEKLKKYDETGEYAFRQSLMFFYRDSSSDRAKDYFELLHYTYYNVKKTANSKQELAYCYLMGYGTDVNIDKALELFKRKQGDYDDFTCYYVGMTYALGLGSYKKDLRKAVEYFKRARSYYDKDALVIAIEEHLIGDDSITKARTFLNDKKSYDKNIEELFNSQLLAVGIGTVKQDLPEAIAELNNYLSLKMSRTKVNHKISYYSRSRMRKNILLSLYKAALKQQNDRKK